MSASASSPATSSASPASPGSSASASQAGGWIVSPLFDLLFFANLIWLVALLPGFVSGDGVVHVEFWQLYFLTTPHRWLTLVLVTADPDGREGRTGLFVLLAVLAFVLVCGVKLGTGGFVCLLLIDYVWNGWHFASQHHGILRIYSRKLGGGWPLLERHGLRLFIFYTIARTAAWSTGWLEDVPYGMTWLYTLDVVMLGIPAALLTLELLDHPQRRPAKLIYLASVSCLYSLLLLSLQAQHRMLILALTVASASFHAIEYLAIVTHYAWRRETSGSAGVFRAMARRWLNFLAVYAILLGLLAVVAHRQATEWWLGINLWAAFLHYTYDGMIWRLRRPATAQALGAQPAVAAPAVAAPAVGAPEAAALSPSAPAPAPQLQPLLPVNAP